MAVLDRERIDTALLLVAFFVGIGSSIVLKIGGYPVWLPAVTSGSVIVAYVAITLTSVRARLDPGQIGDNAYYLGFVLTLASLAYTLYELGVEAGGLGVEARDSDLFRDVIAGFGIALSSTIVGVILRVVLLQYRVDLVAREREIRLQLNDAMRRFHVEVEDFVRGTKFLGIEIRQSLDEHHQQMAKRYEQSIEELVKDLSSGHQKVLEGIVEQSKETNRGLVSSTRNSITNVEQAVLETAGTVSGQMQETNVAINEGVRSAAEVLKRNLQETSELMSGSLSDLRSEVRRSVEEMSRVHAENMKREADLIDEAATSMQSIGSFADGARNSISSAENAVLETLSTVSGQLRENGAAINESTRSTADGLNRSVRKAGEVMSEGMSDLRKEFRHSVEEMSKAHAENMKRESALMDEAATSMQMAISSFAERFEKNLGEVETTATKLSDVSERACQTMDQITANLENFSNEVSKKNDDRPRSAFWIFDRKS